MTIIKAIILIAILFSDIYNKNENKEIMADEGAKSVRESSIKSALIEDFNPLDNIPPELPPVIYIIPTPVTQNEAR